MVPSYANRDLNSESRMSPRSEMPQAGVDPSAGIHGTSGFARQESVFIIGNKSFFIAVKRALDIVGGFHVVGAFKMEDLSTSLRRSTMLGQTPRVAVIHEPPGQRNVADDAAHAVLQTYPNCGIVLISGDELEAESERKLGVHDFSAVVVPESAIKNPVSLARAMHAAISEAGNTERVA